MLFAKPDMLLLDEPTNYLDIEGAVWLEAHIRTYSGTALIISHDRDFLNKAVTHIAHLRGGKLFNYPRVKRLEKMKPVATIISDPIAPIDLPGPERPLNPPIVRFDKVNLGYSDGVNVLRNLEQRIDPDDRIGILGKNGEGKSTFAKAVMGELLPQEGFIKRHKKLRIGYFAQHQIDALNPLASAYDHVVELMPDATEAQRRSRLAQFGLGIKNAETPAGDLSGGEKARLLFSLIGFHKPHLLVLDEPANHLDIDSRAELIKSLNHYEGAVLIISHDRNLLEAVVDRLWLVDKGTVSTYDGSLEDYRALQLEKDRSNKKQASGDNDSRKQLRRESAEIRKRLAPLKKAYENIEAKIAKAKKRIPIIDKELSVSDIFTLNPDKAIKLGQERAELGRLIDALEMEWLKALDSQSRNTLRALFWRRRHTHRI